MAHVWFGALRGSVGRWLAVVGAAVLVVAVLAPGVVPAVADEDPAGRGGPADEDPHVVLAQDAVVVQPLDVCPEQGSLATGFDDVGDSVHRRAIECLVWSGVTRGVEPGRYAPGESVSRGQMAAFLVRMLEAHGVVLDTGDAATFDDAIGTTHEVAIGQLVAAGITRGATEVTFAPGAEVTRGQMAAFLVRSVELVVGSPLAVGEVSFTDAVGSTHEVAIGKAAAAGLAAGVSVERFAPGDVVRRDQMASFVARTLSFLAVNDPNLDLPRGLVPGGPQRTPGASDPRPGTVEFELRDETVVVGDTSSASLVGDTLRIGMDAIDEPQVGGFVVGRAADGVPLGLNDRVVGVQREGDQWVVELEPAALWEPYEELNLDVTMQPDEQSVQELVDALNEAAATVSDGPVFTARLIAGDDDVAGAAVAAPQGDAQVVLASDVPRASTFLGPSIELTLEEPTPDGRGTREGLTVYADPSSPDDRIWLTFQTTVTPSVDLAYQSQWLFGVDYARATMRLEAQSQFGIEAAGSFSSSCDAHSSDPDDLACQQRIRDNLGRALDRVPTNPLELVGNDALMRLERLANRFPGPAVTVRPVFPLALELDASGLVQTTTSGWVVIGAQYDDGELSGVLDYADPPVVDLTGEAQAELRAEAGLGLQILIGRSFGPTVTGSVFGEAAAGVRAQAATGWPRPFFDAWGTADIGINVAASIGVQDPIFGAIGRDWSVYDEDVLRWEIYRSVPTAPTVRVAGVVRPRLEWLEPEHATHYLVAIAPSGLACHLAVRGEAALNGARRVLMRAQSPTVLNLDAWDVAVDDWDAAYACVAAVDGTLDRMSSASNAVRVHSSDAQEPDQDEGVDDGASEDDVADPDDPAAAPGDDEPREERISDVRGADQLTAHATGSISGGVLSSYSVSAGANDFGQLGLGDRDDRVFLTRIPSLPNGVGPGARGGRHTVWVDRGRVLTAGQGLDGRLGHGDDDDRLVPEVVAGLEDVEVERVAAGGAHTLALAADGTVFAFGRGTHGRLGMDDERNRSVPTAVPGLDGVEVAGIAAGGAHSLLYTVDGELFVFGLNEHGQLGLGDEQDRLVPTRVESLADVEVVGIAAGRSHSLVRTADGSVYVFGRNGSGQLGLGDREDRSTPQQLADLSDGAASAIAAGGAHSLVLIGTEAVYSFGAGARGQLGHGDRDDRIVATRIAFFDGGAPVDIAAGEEHSVVQASQRDFLRPGSSNWTASFGSGDNGRLGAGSVGDQLLPIARELP